MLGVWVLAATVVGMALAWAYSAPPLRLKQNGWWGNAACAFCYEGLAWFTGAAALLGALPHPLIIACAVLYSLGAHGIMVLNDFKAIDGDKRMGIRSLPVQLGPKTAAGVACLTMALPQIAVYALLVIHGALWYALGVAAMIFLQVLMMPRLLADPVKNALWYSGLGVTLYVTGMMICAFALRAMAQAGVLP
jgi:chlorophyll/bacteriochlorophyll a synthase